MKTSIQIKKLLQVMLSCFFLSCFFLSCEDFLEIEAPDNKLVSETVFDSDETAISVMTGLYNQLNIGFSGGGPDGITVLSGLSSNVLTTLRASSLEFLELEKHEIFPDNYRNLNLWSSAYSIVYMTNSLLEGLSTSENISEEVRIRLEGEARFVRAFTYFYLVNLYGEVPLLLTTDYQVNSLASRNSEPEVYQQIVTDLEDAMELLEDGYPGERTQVNKSTVIALMARVQLYLQNWAQAAEMSTHVIDQSGTYEILEDLDQVFLANSREAIWQLAPLGRGDGFTNTKEGSTFIIHPFLSFLSQVGLSDDFPAAFKEDDKRLLHWISYDNGIARYYPHKYKIRNSNEDLSEYSMVLRLAEQYLIRAEAKVQMEDLAGGIADLDKIRERAGLDLLSETNPGIGREMLLDLILEERKKELFTEWGHRWLDLKRTDRVEEVMSAVNPLWDDTDRLYPIPEEERMKNPNLSQNPGY